MLSIYAVPKKVGEPSHQIMMPFANACCLHTLILYWIAQWEHRVRQGWKCHIATKWFGPSQPNYKCNSTLTVSKGWCVDIGDITSNSISSTLAHTPRSIADSKRIVKLRGKKKRTTALSKHTLNSRCLCSLGIIVRANLTGQSQQTCK